MHYSHQFKITEKMMKGFAEISGDKNPIHTSLSHAIDKGFDGKVVYGGLIVAQISRMIGMDFPGDNSLWNGLKIDFIKPLMIGKEALIEATVTHESEATSSSMIDFMIYSDEEIIAKGSIGVNKI